MSFPVDAVSIIGVPESVHKAINHGVLIEANTSPSSPPPHLPTEMNEGSPKGYKSSQLAYYLQKPSLEKLQGYNGGSDTAVIDTGVVIFTGTACQVSFLIASYCDFINISVYTFILLLRRLSSYLSTPQSPSATPHLTRHPHNHNHPLLLLD